MLLCYQKSLMRTSEVMWIIRKYNFVVVCVRVRVSVLLPQSSLTASRFFLCLFVSRRRVREGGAEVLNVSRPSSSLRSRTIHRSHQPGFIRACLRKLHQYVDTGLAYSTNSPISSQIIVPQKRMSSLKVAAYPTPPSQPATPPPSTSTPPQRG